MVEKAIGVDLGGTKVCAGVFVLGAPQPLSVEVQPTEADRPEDEIVGRIVEAIAVVVERAGVEDIGGIGMGVPTRLDREGRLIPGPNLPTGGRLDLSPLLQEHFQWPVRVANDAVCFTLAEYGHGAGRGSSVCCGITLGTGIGMGIVVEGKPMLGYAGLAGEIWCAPLGEAMLEDVVSGRGVMRLYEERAGERIRPEEIARRARDGDWDAQEAWNAFGDALGIGLSYVIGALDPEVIVIGGSIGQAFDRFETPMMDRLRRHTMEGASLCVKPGVLGPEAGALGAAHLVLSCKDVEEP